MVPTGFGEMLTISGEAGEPNHKILDIFHAREHLWSYARSYFDTEIAAKAGQNRQMTETDGPKPVLAAMAEPEAQHPGADPKKVAEHHGELFCESSRPDGLSAI